METANVYITNNNWSLEEKSIMETAGIEKEEKDILDFKERNHYKP